MYMHVLVRYSFMYTVTVPVSVHVYARSALVLILCVWAKPDLVHHVQVVVGCPRLHKRPRGAWC